MAVRCWGKTGEAAARTMEDGSEGALCGAKVCVCVNCGHPQARTSALLMSPLKRSWLRLVKLVLWSIGGGREGGGGGIVLELVKIPLLVPLRPTFSCEEGRGVCVCVGAVKNSF